MSPLDGFVPFWRAPWDFAGLPFPYDQNDDDTDEEEVEDE